MVTAPDFTVSEPNSSVHICTGDMMPFGIGCVDPARPTTQDERDGCVWGGVTRWQRLRKREFHETEMRDDLTPPNRSPNVFYPPNRHLPTDWQAGSSFTACMCQSSFCWLRKALL